MKLHRRLKKLIVIAGPTASGKTDLAIQIAKHFKTDILSADSRQCYKELNIGVAKPSAEQLQSVLHYFINSHSIHDEVSAGEYERYGLEKLDTIFSESDIAVCVGGTGMYIKALCEGIDEMPSVDMSIYNQIENEYKEKGIAWLKEEVRQADEAFFMQGEIDNPSRLLRALSFKRSTGKSILDYRKNKIKQRDFEIIKYAIDIDRKILYERINERVDVMMNEGLSEEVKNLFTYKDLKSLNTVGYTELFEYLDGKLTFEESIEKIKQHTRNYAKRQITWFKNQGGYTWLTSENILDEVIKMSA